jgi:hypothetical protein
MPIYSLLVHERICKAINESMHNLCIYQFYSQPFEKTTIFYMNSKNLKTIPYFEPNVFICNLKKENSKSKHHDNISYVMTTDNEKRLLHKTFYT